MITAAPTPERTNPADAAALPPVDAPSARLNRPASLKRIFARWHAVANFVVPIGYEDESGFHFGEEEVSDQPDGRA